jgi:hypothetical protein
MSLSQFQASATAAHCEAEIQCGWVPSRANCGEQNHWNFAQLQADIAAGTVVYDGTQAAACLDALYGSPTGTTCLSAFWGAKVLLPLPAPCRALFKGNVAAGGDCFQSEECASGACVKVGTAYTPCDLGTCGGMPAPIGSVEIGGACAQDSECADGAFCDSLDECAPLLGLGASCSGAVDRCSPDLECVTTGTTATCAKLPGEGADCSSLRCGQNDHYCQPSTHTCQPRRGVGDSCADDTSACVYWAYCDATSTCKAFKLAGEACDPTSLDMSELCVSSFHCAGTCVATEVCPAK